MEKVVKSPARAKPEEIEEKPTRPACYADGARWL